MAAQSSALQPTLLLGESFCLSEQESPVRGFPALLSRLSSSLPSFMFFYIVTILWLSFLPHNIQVYATSPLANIKYSPFLLHLLHALLWRWLWEWSCWQTCGLAQ